MYSSNDYLLRASYIAHTIVGTGGIEWGITRGPYFHGACILGGGGGETDNKYICNNLSDNDRCYGEKTQV